MMERVRILVVASSTAPVRGLTARLRDPDVDVVVSSSAREALDRIGPSMPQVVVIDGSLPGRDVFRLYGRLRALPAGATVPIIFSAHERSNVEAAPTTAPDFYLGPDATLDDVEQLIYTFLPESLVETDVEDEEDEEEQAAQQAEPDEADVLARALSGRAPRSEPPVPPSPSTWKDIGERAQTGPAVIALAYLGMYCVAEVLAATIDTRFGLFVHGVLMLAIALNAINVPEGPERTLFTTLWLAPLTRVYGLAQPYSGFSPLTWWALTMVPMVVAGVLALRFGGLSAREAGLIPSPQEVPIAVLLAPVGLAVGFLMYMVLEPRALGRDLASANLAFVALTVIMNPGLVDELVFRGVMQRASIGVLGGGLGILYTGLLYAPIVPAGLASGSLTAVVLTFGIGLLLSLLTARTGSILSAAVAHASLALGLFVIAPYWAPGGLGLAGGTPTAPSSLDTRLPTARPITVISGSPTLVPAPAAGSSQPGPSVQPSAPAQPGPTGPGQPAAKPSQTGQASPGLAATAVSLAPPLAAPPQPAAPTQVPPESSPAAPVANGPGSSGQIVVVRGTGGAGARLRSQPGSGGPIITVVPEYTPLVVVGADRQADGMVWRNVRAPNGLEGWIAASFVTPGQ